ncbi:DUF4260 domain-containing protein [Vibrio maritimus]|jgi:hypothetical protein
MAFVEGKVRTVLRLEGLCILGAAVFLFAQLSGDWKLFAWLFFVPDLALLAYLFSPKVGAFTYNCSHSFIGAAVLLISSVLVANNTVLSVSIIWFAHIGFDRALGYGLKYGSDFHKTHLGQIGFRSNT